MTNGRYHYPGNDDWMRARSKALIQALVDMMARRSRDLVPLEEVRLRLPMRSSHYRGLQAVPLTHIVGSQGRYADFDRYFLPRQAHLRQRWQQVYRAHATDVPLPPVELYKIGMVYFIQDGHHRVSVARLRGQAEIDAYVTELIVDVPFDERLSVRDLLLKEEYGDFLGWTALHRLRPQQRIEISALGGYLHLIQHINHHRRTLACKRGAEVSKDEAVASWYDHVYLPVVEAIQQRKLLTHFPNHSAADVYLWVMDNVRECIQERHEITAVAVEYVLRLKTGSKARAIRRRLLNYLQRR